MIELIVVDMHMVCICNNFSTIKKNKIYLGPETHIHLGPFFFVIDLEVAAVLVVVCF